MWIAFRLYLWGIGDTSPVAFSSALRVVNCFQIVSLRYWWHLVAPFPFKCSSCELLSDCIFEVLVTPPWARYGATWRLWIAFRLYLWGIGDTTEIGKVRRWKVVNCFQIVSLRYWWHHCGYRVPTLPSCELLSDCIFEVLVTPNIQCIAYLIMLWIAFRLYLWGIGDT